MTEQDMEIQVLRGENKRLIKERNAAIKAREKTRAELLAENIRLRAERDAAVADLAVEKDCRFCKFYDESLRVGWYCGREDCHYGESDKWEWRGVQDG